MSDLAAIIDNARQRLFAMVNDIRQLAADGHASFQQHLMDGHDVLYLRDAAYLGANRARFAGS